jgi:CHASE2 domain-containing sensor protein
MKKEMKLLIITLILMVLMFGCMIALCVLFGWVAGVLAFVLYVSSVITGALYTHDRYVKPLRKQLDEYEDTFIVDVRPHAN